MYKIHTSRFQLQVYSTKVLPLLLPVDKCVCIGAGLAACSPLFLFAGNGGR